MFKFHSYKFAPAHYYTLEAFLSDEDIRYKATYALDEKYYDFGSLEVRIPQENSNKTVHIHLNSSVFTLLHIIMCWLLRKDTIILMHEPILDLPGKLKHYSQCEQKIKIFIVKYINDLICLFSKKIIVFSKTAEANLRPKFKLKASRQKLPFTLRDASENKINKSEKIQICYIGTIANDHNFDAFIDWVQSSELDRDHYNFNIFTKDKINIEDREKLSKLCHITDGRILSMSEMAMAYKHSDFTWCVYSSSNQSGVLPMALMYGSVPLVSEAFGEDICDYIDCTILISDLASHSLDRKIREATGEVGKLKTAARDAYDCHHNPKFMKWEKILNV